MSDYAHDDYAAVLRLVAGDAVCDPKVFKREYNPITWNRAVLADPAVTTSRAIALANALADSMGHKRHPFARFAVLYRSDSVNGPNHLAAWPAQPDLAAKARLSVDTLVRAVEDLVGQGWLEVRKEGRYYRYLLTFPHVPSVWNFADPMWQAEPSPVAPELPHHAEDDEDEEDELPHFAEDDEEDELPQNAETHSAKCGRWDDELPQNAESSSAPCGTIHINDPRIAVKKIHTSESPALPAPPEGAPAEGHNLSQEEEAQEHKPTRRLALVQVEDDFEEEEPVVLKRGRPRKPVERPKPKHLCRDCAVALPVAEPGGKQVVRCDPCVERRCG